ncbi:hypothetical protein HNQ91_003045 [Filimonas zeae]|uniref:HmuY protein n=1 Tax=Filimonas zeae TaxID=1737353 RepID=A0A917J0G6_9BACT|nr:HmuY family protein [Filimonas zeae]MDR6339980.1 hypothetical protein [Filimonas zeae]GGH70562.1 hypothetical protein GCM10011379_28980 [Filimonas zeae]
MRILTVAVLLGLCCSCTKNNNATDAPDVVSVVIKDLPGDTAARMGTGGSMSFKTVYFNLDSGKAVTITDADKATTKWDLAFTGPYNSEVYVNYGGYQYNPGYGGPGKGAVLQIEKPYQEVTTAPSDADFSKTTLTKIGWESGSNGGWFFYSMDNHIAVPIKNRTFVIRTATGKYAKLELLNVYKGNPPVVTDLYWPSPYLNFRYFIQADGSRSLRTQ